MKAVICRKWGGPHVLSLSELPSPPLPEGYVRIKVKAAGIGFQDILIVAGKYGLQPEFPFSPGNEVAGEVIECSESIRDLPLGSRVIAVLPYGGYAEEVVVPRGAIAVLPNNIHFVTAASLGIAYGTAHQALIERAQISAGEILLVRGAAGGVGLAAIEIGRAKGATIIAAAGSSEKLAVAEQAGAHHLINTNLENVRECVLNITEGRGADVIFDPVGTDFKQSCLRCIARKGRILIVGFAGGIIPDIPAHYILNKYCSVVGVAWGNSYLQHEPSQFIATLANVVKLCAQGDIKPRIERAVPPEDVVPVLQDIASRKTYGRSVISFQQAQRESGVAQLVGKGP